MSAPQAIQSELRPVIYASAPAPVSMRDSWYHIADLDHFWMRRRFDVFRYLAGPLIRDAARIAEIGCGNGIVQTQIEQHYGVPVAGFDLNEFALKKNVSSLSPVYCYDIHQRSPEFQARFDLVLLFDVLEHIHDEASFLESTMYHMSDSGTLAINVPAHQALYSKYDQAVGHVRRYSIRSLSAALQKTGLKIRSYTYWGLPLLPLLFARKAILSLRRHTDPGIIEAGFDPGGRRTNSSLGLLARCEPLPQRHFGISLMALVERQR